MTATAAGITFDPQWAESVEKAIDEELTRLMLALYDTDDRYDPVDETGEPFCGCSDCERRVSMYVIIRGTLKGAAEGRVALA